ncbi:hypothetical protein [Haloechinothrix salitolerans]|uniref:Helix-turn-helix domain of resolvase n=1 Tax=Haloechinothrix salitolerans TaxID=926830 RepID=A0ABW2C735_9PSEU
MSDDMLQKLRAASEQVQKAEADHQALTKQIKDLETRKRTAFRQTKRLRAELRTLVREAVAQGELSKTEIADAAQVSRPALYTFIEDND